MDIQTARELLDLCVREELFDLTFGDAEIEWFFDGKNVATGYSGRSETSVTIWSHVEPDADAEGYRVMIARYSGEDVLVHNLLSAGTTGRRERNDGQG